MARLRGRDRDHASFSLSIIRDDEKKGARKEQEKCTFLAFSA